jgi:hypothetical protein
VLETPGLRYIANNMNECFQVAILNSDVRWMASLSSGLVELTTYQAAYPASKQNKIVGEST